MTSRAMFTQYTKVFIDGAQLGSVCNVSREQDGIHVDAHYLPGDTVQEGVLNSIQQNESVHISVVLPANRGRWNAYGNIQGRAVLPPCDIAKLTFSVLGTVIFVEDAPNG